jgi:hypothetical protein
VDVSNDPVTLLERSQAPVPTTSPPQPWHDRVADAVRAFEWNGTTVITGATTGVGATTGAGAATGSGAFTITGSGVAAEVGATSAAGTTTSLDETVITGVVGASGTRAAGAAGGRLTYRQLAIGQMSQDDLLEMLAARDRYKDELFAEAIAALERDPTLADLDVCKTMEQIETGDCLADEALIAAAKATASGTATSAAPAPGTPTATAAPMPGTSTAAAPAPASPPPAAAGPAAAAAPPPQTAAAPASPAGQAKSSQGVDVAAFAVLLGTQKVKSAALPQIQRKVALLIGIDRYDDPRMPQLTNAVGDARAVGHLLATRFGYETIVIENGTRQRMVAALNRLATLVNPSDSVVIYYAGHGAVVPSTGLGYWQPANANPDDPKTWISNADIGRMISRLGATQVALISDSCYSGSLVPDERIRPSTGNVDPVAMLSRKAAVVMSSGGNEPVFDLGKDGHSPFAWNLMHTLQQVSSWQPGEGVFERVRFGVARELPQRPRYGGSVASGHQAGGDYLFEQRQLDATP